MTDDSIINSDERIVMVREVVDDEEHVFYAIRDVELDYWRSMHPIYDDRAWTRDRRQRAEFDTRADAIRELELIRRWRWYPVPNIVDEIPWESEAA